MPNSNRGAFGRGNGTITVIEEPVLRSYRRKAKIVFYVDLGDHRPAGRHRRRQQMAPDPRPGSRSGLRPDHRRHRRSCRLRMAGPSRPLVVDPRNRLTGSLVFGWIELAEHTTLIYRLAFVAAIVGVPAAIKPVRTRLYEIVVVPDHPAPHPDLLLRIHHHQPHRQPAADLVGHAHPRRGTRLDLAAPRPVPR